MNSKERAQDFELFVQQLISRPMTNEESALVTVISLTEPTYVIVEDLLVAAFEAGRQQGILRGSGHYMHVAACSRCGVNMYSGEVTKADRNFSRYHLQCYRLNQQRNSRHKETNNTH